MRNDLFDTYYIYTSKEMAEKINIKTPTVRKYGQLLEKYGYKFEKNGERRNFTDKDVIVMQKMKESTNIERTAKELADLQRNGIDINDIKPDMTRNDINISPSDTGLIVREFQQKMADSEKRYGEMMNQVLGELKENQMIMQQTTQELADLRHREAEKQKTIDDMSEKLSKAVDLLLEMEKNQEKNKKKSIFEMIKNISK
ncbi:hypothetical protein [Bacillus cereus]|uniref:hypothetical protein n=1 Tax=Bacillus cereus TaxID=1396 RepID=UPI001F469AF4|nr:hypothetical protein [Bacillus cereus]BCC56676.1 hypothetical protein BCJMU07_p77 [Bacillus cereus]